MTMPETIGRPLKRAPQIVTRALVVYNPKAGQAETLQRDLDEACAIWRAAGWQVDLCPTTGPGDGTRLAREAAAQGYTLVVAAGGDGTVNEVVNGLAGSNTALGALPIGTVNVWVREVGLPLQPRAAAEALLNATPERVDLGRAGDRYFLLMAGVGLDAAITASVRSEDKQRLGVLAYVLRTVNVAMRWRGTRVRLTLDGKPVNGRMLMVVVGNSQLYGGFVKITARASINDGLLDVCIIRGKAAWSLPLNFLAVLVRRHDLDPGLEYHRARSILIESRDHLPVQVDGDAIGETPILIEAVPGALLVLIPPRLRKEDLLTSAPPVAEEHAHNLIGRLTRRLILRRTHRPGPPVIRQ